MLCHMARSKGRRVLSYTEISTAQTCEARWDFKYGGHLAGTCLKRRSQVTRLSDGGAWGAAVAAWHASQGQLDPMMQARAALIGKLAEDQRAAFKRGWDIPDSEVETQRARLDAIFVHYTETTTPLPNLTLLEGEFEAPIPSRTGRGSSNLYRFQNFIDGYTVDANGHQWIVEFKLRDHLHPAWLINSLRQYRWYCWIVGKMQGYSPVGIIVDERVNDSPHPPKINKPTKACPQGPVSSDKRQKLDPVEYIAACRERDQEPDSELLMVLQSLRWNQREWVQYDPDELIEGGRELTSAAAHIGELDSGKRYPVRNASTMTCNGCDFKDICPDPAGASFLINQAFVSTTPKRLRNQETP